MSRLGEGGQRRNRGVGLRQLWYSRALAVCVKPTSPGYTAAARGRHAPRGMQQTYFNTCPSPKVPLTDGRDVEAGDLRLQVGGARHHEAALLYRQQRQRAAAR